MFGLGNFAKMARGGMGLDQVAEMLSGAIGGNVDLSPLAETSGEIITAKLGPFEPGQRSLVMTGTTRSGETIKAVLILSPARPLVH